MEHRYAETSAEQCSFQQICEFPSFWNGPVKIAHGGQWDEANAVGKVIEQLSRYLKIQARFADTTGTREGHQMHL